MKVKLYPWYRDLQFQIALLLIIITIKLYKWNSNARTWQDTHNLVWDKLNADTLQPFVKDLITYHVRKEYGLIPKAFQL